MTREKKRCAKCDSGCVAEYNSQNGECLGFAHRKATKNSEILLQKSFGRSLWILASRLRSFLQHKLQPCSFTRSFLRPWRAFRERANDALRINSSKRFMLRRRATIILSYYLTPCNNFSNQYFSKIFLSVGSSASSDLDLSMIPCL